MDDKARREVEPCGARLTVREIRGLLTRIGAELARTAGASLSPQVHADQFRLIDTGKFVEQMKPFLRMN